MSNSLKLNTREFLPRDLAYHDWRCWFLRPLKGVDFANLHLGVGSMKTPNRQSGLKVNGVSTIADIGGFFDALAEHCLRFGYSVFRYLSQTIQYIIGISSMQYMLHTCIMKPFFVKLHGSTERVYPPSIWEVTGLNNVED